MNNDFYTQDALGSAFGRAWRKTVNSYSDLPNRTERGRRIYLTGRILSFDIEALPEGGGRITAEVRGSRNQPYKVTINADSLSPESLRRLSASQEKLGRSDILADTLARKTPGLFPLNSEITFDCTCPDWAHMCKHVAAVMFRFADMLDYCPTCILTLRGAEDTIITEDSLRRAADRLLARVSCIPDNMLSDSEADRIFGKTER